MSTNRPAQQVNSESSRSGILKLCRGPFTATVEPYRDRYAFAIRDHEREQPVIHGFGMDRRSAIRGVVDLLEMLVA